MCVTEQQADDVRFLLVVLDDLVWCPIVLGRCCERADSYSRCNTLDKDLTYTYYLYYPSVGRQNEEGYNRLTITTTTTGPAFST